MGGGVELPAIIIHFHRNFLKVPDKLTCLLSASARVFLYLITSFTVLFTTLIFLFSNSVAGAGC